MEGPHVGSILPADRKGRAVAIAAPMNASDQNGAKRPEACLPLAFAFI